MENLTKLQQIEIAGKDLIKYYCPEYTFIWDRSKRRKGQRRGALKEIGISKPIAELNTFECMLLTVVHEIAHVLAPEGSGHNKNWKRICLSLGGDGKARYSEAEVQLPELRRQPRWRSL